MPFLLILLFIAVAFAVDLFLGWLVWLVAPLTGIDAISALTFWNAFWVVILGNIIVSPAVASSSK